MMPSRWKPRSAACAATSSAMCSHGSGERLTIHQALPWVVRRSPLPWLHIAEEVAAQAAERGFHRLGIIGTRYLVDSEVYPEKLTARSIGYLRPNTAERAEVNRIIFEELVAGVFRPEAMASIQRVMARMKDERSEERRV